MARPSGKANRIAALDQLCRAGTILHIADAARRIGASEITIRRDLGEGAGGLVCLGGYVMRAQEGAEGYSLTAAETREAAAKQIVAAEAAALIEPGDTIFLDCGTTTPCLAARVPQNAHVTVVTQALNIAEAVARLQGVNLILLAGLYHRETASFSSDEAVAMLGRINITKGFFSAAGVHETEGVTCFHFHEVPVKRAALARSQQRYLVCDRSKWGKLRPATYARLDAFDRWIGGGEGTGR
ncbi:DeoR/GlpR family DNA-binding transcription regulator [Paenirhodobacter populi]|uniref:DeoR/GlpR family DNA-binding transcription regulator n=1 Tax=Paenirhodobacter populi TaxID=2306993 RepID=UPI000FE31AE8|nr:DeoR/GlpR family DNA-binding transcription regulator [Sinirhodobacter populi]RWR06198.1 DeoR/GlpR transcriptional regulator [Sinirhodobacter populi]